ncbi:hypothetical protein [Novosphingobium terrae]|uniref:hypothetical protein n=1 Tax=Novosphingobium terrae TaxID=2726189 RepID=UPI0019810548|nr:hypothetical protein [Novosphingobium terrae]
MVLIEAISLGGMAGVLVESGKRGVIKSWSNRDQLPPLVKLLTLIVLIAVPLAHAGTLSGFVTAALLTVGAFTVARWSVASLIVLWRRRR